MVPQRAILFRAVSLCIVRVHVYLLPCLLSSYGSEWPRLLPPSCITFFHSLAPAAKLAAKCSDTLISTYKKTTWCPHSEEQHCRGSFAVVQVVTCCCHVALLPMLTGYHSESSVLILELVQFYKVSSSILLAHIKTKQSARKKGLLPTISNSLFGEKFKFEILAAYEIEDIVLHLEVQVPSINHIPYYKMLCSVKL